MSLRIDEYVSSNGAVSGLLNQQTTANNVTAENTAKKDGDSYVSTISNSEDAIPSENYNDILQVMRKSKAESGGLEESTQQAADTETVSGAGGSGGSGGDSESEEETTTETVVIDGVTYLETTTVIDGITSVQRTRISGQADGENTAEQKVTDNEN